MELRAQTKMICQSLPGLEQWFIEYDAQGHDWIIVRWESKDPAKVVSADLTVPPTIPDNRTEVQNRFSSRTAALRRSADLCREIVGSTEETHWGVWQWNSGSDTHYQTVFPAEAWRRLPGQSTPAYSSEHVHSTVDVPGDAKAQFRRLDPLTLTPSYLARLSTQMLEAMQIELNSDDSGLRERITGELVRRSQIEENHKPSSDRPNVLSPTSNAKADTHSKSPQTTPKTEDKIENTVAATKAEPQQPTADRLPKAESQPKKRDWWQFWLPKS